MDRPDRGTECDSSTRSTVITSGDSENSYQRSRSGTRSDLGMDLPVPVQVATVEPLESFTKETQRLTRHYDLDLAAPEARTKSLLHQASVKEPLTRNSHDHSNRR